MCVVLTFTEQNNNFIRQNEDELRGPQGDVLHHCAVTSGVGSIRNGHPAYCRRDWHFKDDALQDDQQHCCSTQGQIEYHQHPTAGAIAIDDINVPQTTNVVNCFFNVFIERTK